MATDVRMLSDAQAEAFDVDYVAPGARWALIRDRIRGQFGATPFTVLDVGGGNGSFVDRLLDEFPHASGTVLEPSELLLGRNAPNERKTLLPGTAADLPAARYDLICVHWLLHHLVSGSYTGTRDEQVRTLRALRDRLTARGRISVYENIYQGWLTEDLPGWLIYQATALRSLAGLTKRLGANTAGVGVCFHSLPTWRQIVAEAGLRVVDDAEPDTWVWPVPWWYRPALTLRRISTGHAWLAA